MIVVGTLGVGDDAGAQAAEVARRAAATGARVEMIGVAGADAAGDARLIELAAAGVGHATVIRSAADDIEPADLELALRYLPEIRAIVLVRPSERLVSTAAAASEWTGATLVVAGVPIATPDGGAGTGLPDGAIVLEPPERDPDGTFAGFVAAFAVRLEAGEPAERAWKATTAALAADPVGSGD